MKLIHFDAKKDEIAIELKMKVESINRGMKNHIEKLLLLILHNHACKLFATRSGL